VRDNQFGSTSVSFGQSVKTKLCASEVDLYLYFIIKEIIRGKWMFNSVLLSQYTAELTTNLS